MTGTNASTCPSRRSLGTSCENSFHSTVYPVYPGARKHPQPHVQDFGNPCNHFWIRRSSQDPHDRLHRGRPEFHQRHGVPLGQQQCEPSGYVALRAMGSLASWAFRKAPPCTRSDAVSGSPGLSIPSMSKCKQLRNALLIAITHCYTIAPQPGRELIP